MEGCEKMTNSEVASMKNELEQIKDNAIQVTNQNGFLDQNQIPKGKKVYNIECSLMFVDLRNSTEMTTTVGRKNMVKIYQMYTKIVKKSVESNEGKVLQIVGDGILCAFTHDNGNSSGKKAVSTALSIHTYIKESMNPILSDELKIKCGIGIRTGHVYVTRLLVANQNSQVAYPSNITNYASKLCSEASDRDIIFDAKTFEQLPNEWKNIVVNHRSDWGNFYKMEGRTWRIE